MVPEGGVPGAHDDGSVDGGGAGPFTACALDDAEGTGEDGVEDRGEVVLALIRIRSWSSVMPTFAARTSTGPCDSSTSLKATRLCGVGDVAVDG